MRQPASTAEICRVVRETTRQRRQSMIKIILTILSWIFPMIGGGEGLWRVGAVMTVASALILAAMLLAMMVG